MILILIVSAVLAIFIKEDLVRTKNTTKKLVENDIHE